MGSEWPSIPLADLTSAPVTYGVVQPGHDDPSGVPMLRVNNFVGNSLSYSDVLRISPTIEAKYSRTRCRAGDVLVTIVGSVGQVITVPPELSGWNIARAIALIRPKTRDMSRWIACVLRSPQTQHRLGVVANTTVQTTINLKDLRALQIPMPDETTRNGICDVLGALDDRIDNLRATNATLEAIAQALFKSWFVDFDPVHAKAEARAPEGMDAATAALFPSEFEDSELGPVPRGWCVASIGSLMRIKGGKQLAKENFSEDGLNPVFGGAGEMGRSDKFNAEGLVITVGRVGAYCGRFFLHVGKAWVNNNASRIQASSAVGFWAYWCLKNLDIDSIKKGAAQPFVSNSDIADLLVAIPSQHLIDEFNFVCTQIHNRISLGLEHATTLIGLRDTLLPRLISGKLSLPEASESAESVST